MAKVDVVVIGAGAAGLTAGALLAKHGKKVLVLDKSPAPRRPRHGRAGRGLQAQRRRPPARGLGLRHHQGLRAPRQAPRPRAPSRATCRSGTTTKDQWGSIRDRYSGNKDELKKVIKALIDTPFEEFEKWDDRSLREWMLQHTTDQGVIDLWEFLAVLECLTDEWWDHSASDNLYVRKMHYEEKRMAGYSFWPEQGWDGLFQDLADAVTENGGEVRMGTPAERVIIENHEVKGVAVSRGSRGSSRTRCSRRRSSSATPSSRRFPSGTCSRSCPSGSCRTGTRARSSSSRSRTSRSPGSASTSRPNEPAAILDRKELSTWLHAPITRTPGFFFEQTAYDPSTAPAGTYLYVMGAVSRARGAPTSATCSRCSRSSRRRSGSCTRCSRTRSGAGGTSSTTPPSA